MVGVEDWALEMQRTGPNELWELEVWLLSHRDVHVEITARLNAIS